MMSKQGEFVPECSLIQVSHQFSCMNCGIEITNPDELLSHYPDEVNKKNMLDVWSKLVEFSILAVFDTINGLLQQGARGGVAQLVEQLAFNPKVVGSNPTAPTINAGNLAERRNNDENN